jgi:hypothetical protein
MTSQQRNAIARLIDEYPYKEDEKTHLLFSEFGELKKQGYILRSDALRILRWKSPRPTRFYIQNSESDFRSITEAAFLSRNERLRMHSLTALKGVKYPAASAILMFYDPKQYPVIDIRVWQQLHRLNFVTTNSKGQGFSLDEWITYLDIMRDAAREFRLPVRQLEKRFFDLDQAERKENLYRS